MLIVIGLSVFFVLSCSRDAACRVRLLLVCFCSHAFLFSRRLRKERRVFCIHAGAGGVASFATTEGAEVGEGGAKRFFRESIEYTFVSFEGSNPHCDARTGWGGVFFSLSPQQPGELIVDGMSGFGGNDMSFYGSAHKGDVADDVQQFVSCRLIVPHEPMTIPYKSASCALKSPGPSRGNEDTHIAGHK